MSFLKDLIESAFPVAYAEEVCISIFDDFGAHWACEMKT